MTKSFDGDQPDGRLLGWLAVWSISLTMVVAVMLGGLANMPDEAHVTLGFALGGMVATWVTMGTWVVLIHLPVQTGPADPERAEQQQWLPRLAVLLVWIANVVMFAIFARQESGIVAQVLLMVAVGIMGPLIAWQWTHQWIHREQVPPRPRRSIRDLLGIAVTIAIGSAALRMGDRWFGLTSSVTVLAISIAILWIVMLPIMLSRWWGLIFVTIPLVAAQWMTVAMMVDIRSLGAESELRRLLGITCGFYLFALLFLLLMRSSGHRWLGQR